MKIHFLILLCLAGIGMKSQVKEKDTLFFGVDKYYTISPSIKIPQLNQTYYKKLGFEKLQIKQTNTDGYIFFNADSVYTQGIKPKKIASIKEYIENKKFYHDGVYNKIVDKWKLKDSLSDKYVIFFVNGKEFIKSKDLEYISYYPIQKDMKLIQNRRKDTLFFKFNNKYIHESDIDSDTDPHCNPKRFLLEDSGKSKTGIFFFEEYDTQTRPKFKTKKSIDLKNYIHSLRFYNPDKEIIEDFNLSEYLNNYVIFLDTEINEKHDYVQIKPSITLE